MQNAAITLRSLGSAFDNDAGGRAILTSPFIPSRRKLPLRGRSILRLRRAPSSRGCSTGMQKRNLQKKSVKPQIREYRFPHISFHPAAGANRRPFGAPPFKGRREHTHYPPHKSLPRVGNVASAARRIGCWRYDNEREKASQAGDAEGRRHKNTFSLKEGTKKRSPCGLRFLISKTTH